MPPPLTTGDVEDVSKKKPRIPEWLRVGLAGAAAATGTQDQYGLWRKLGQAGRAVYDDSKDKKGKGKASGTVQQGSSAQAASFVEPNRPYGIPMGYAEYVGEGGPVIPEPQQQAPRPQPQPQPQPRPAGGGATPPQTTPPGRIIPGMEWTPPRRPQPPNIATGYTPIPPGSPNIQTGYSGRQDSSRGPQEQVESRVRSYDGIVRPPQTPTVPPSGSEPPTVPPNISTGYSGRVTGNDRGLRPDVRSTIRFDNPPEPPIAPSQPPNTGSSGGTTDPGIQGAPSGGHGPLFPGYGGSGSLNDPRGPNINYGPIGGGGGTEAPGVNPLLPNVTSSINWNNPTPPPGVNVYDLPGRDRWADPSMYYPGGGFANPSASGLSYEDERRAQYGGGRPSDYSYYDDTGSGMRSIDDALYEYYRNHPEESPYGYATGGLVRGPVVAKLGEDEPEVVVPFSKVPQFAQATLARGGEPVDPAEIPDVPKGPPALSAPPVPPDAGPMMEGPPAMGPPVLGSPNIAPRTQPSVQLPGPLGDAKKPSVLRRIIAGGIGAAAGVSNARGGARPIDASGITQEILYPGRAEEVRRNREASQRAKDEVALRGAEANIEQSQASAEASRASADASRQRAESEKVQWSVDSKGRLYNRITGEIKTPAPSPKERYDEAIGIGATEEQARYYSLNGKMPEPKGNTSLAPGASLADSSGKIITTAPTVEKPPAVPPQNRATWIATMNDPKATPESKAAAKANLDEDDKRQRQNHPPGGGGGMFGTSGGQADDPKIIAREIIEGRQSPELTGLYGRGSAVRAELGRNQYNHATALTDWKAVQRHIATLNGPQQERLRQAVNFTYDSLDQISDLYDEWKKVAGVSGIKILNRGNLAISKQLGGKAGEVATNLEAQINDLTSELGTVYKGGNSSTDESLRLAGENLKADWNEQTFKRAMDQIRKNLQIRRNSINSSQPQGVSANSPYTGGGGGQAAPQADGGMITVQTADGKTGQIHSSQWENFLKANPGAKRQ